MRRRYTQIGAQIGRRSEIEPTDARYLRDRVRIANALHGFDHRPEDEVALWIERPEIGTSPAIVPARSPESAHDGAAHASGQWDLRITPLNGTHGPDDVLDLFLRLDV